MSAVPPGTGPPAADITATRHVGPTAAGPSARAADRLPSGHPALDDVLAGGLPKNAITLITGRPGSGKTILAQQYLFHTATPQRPSVYLSTVAEPLEKIVRFGQSLDFFDLSTIGTSVIYDSIAEPLTDTGLDAVVDCIAKVIAEYRPGLIVIDSFKALQAFAADPSQFRRFLHQLAGTLGAFPVTSLFVGEYSPDEIGIGAEFAVADAIVDLAPTQVGTRQVRYLQVHKLRGSSFHAGQHAYRLSRAGIHLFPRLADGAISQDYPLATGRTSSGVPALDALLDDGYHPGASTLIAGPSGIGKTLIGLHFITYGADHGEPGVIASLQENRTQLQRTATGFGWTLDHPHIHLMYRSPVDVYVDEWVHDLLTAIDRTGSRRVLIDSLGDVRLAAADDTRFREFVYSLVQRCSQHGVSVMMTMETPDLFTTRQISSEALSALSDNVILLSYTHDNDTLGRTITVIKTRGSDHDPSIRTFTITPTGVHLRPNSGFPTPATTGPPPDATTPN